MEYGSGKSTYTFASRVESVDSVEHDARWYDKVKDFKDKDVNVIYQPDLNIYPYSQGRFDEYDLIFIDGRERAKCLHLAHDLLSEDGIVVLHDAQRQRYMQGIIPYRYCIFTDKGCTAVLTNSKKVEKKLKGMFE